MDKFSLVMLVESLSFGWMQRHYWLNAMNVLLIRAFI